VSDRSIGEQFVRSPGWRVHRIASELEDELVRAEQDGITIEQAPEVQGDGSALQGYLAGVRMAIAIVRGDV
jgi:hypothetical protein